MKKRIWLILLVLAMLTGCLSACGASSVPAADQISSAAEEAVPAVAEEQPGEDASAVPEASEPEKAYVSSVEGTAPVEEPEIQVSYPLTEDDITFDYMNREYPLVTTLLENEDWNNHLLLQEAEKITGVKINYIPVAAFNTGEVYSLSFASGDLADIYYWGVHQYSKGADGAVEDDIFIRLNELIDEYAPYYKRARESDENTMRDTISDEGNIVSFYVLNTENVYSGMGFMTRKDLLDQAGLDIPVTYDDWYEMLTAYKNMGVEIPCYNLGDMGGLLFGGWGFEYNWISFMNNPYFQVDNKVQFSPFAENFLPMLETFHKWYSEGLVMEDFYSMHDMSDTQAKEYNGVTATWVCYANAVNVFRNNTTIEGAEAVAIPNPVINKGDQIHISTSTSLVGNDCGAISTQCEDPELAVQWMDFWYSPKGSELVNYGVEGVSFEYDDAGEPQFTDVVLNNEYGLTMEAIQALYLGYNFGGLFDPTVMLTTYDQGQLDAMDIWTSNIDDDWNYPLGASLTAEETEEFMGYYSDIATYLSTEAVSFVTGARNLGTFDDFIDTLKSMGADRCLEIRQTALDRYYSKALN